MRALQSLSSLRARLLLLVFLAIVPAIALVLYTAAEDRRREGEHAREKALGLVRTITRDQAHAMESARQILITLGQLPDVRRRDGAACSRVLAGVWKQYPRYANLGAVAPDGTVFCSAVPMGEERRNASDNRWFRQAAQERGLVVSGFHFGGITGKAVLTTAYPVVNGRGELQAVLFASLDLVWLNRIVAEAELPPGSVLAVIDPFGTILAHFPDPDIWVGTAADEAPIVRAALADPRAGVADIPGIDGRLRLFAYAPLDEAAPITGARVLVGIPPDVAYAETERMLWRNLLGLGAVAILAFVAAWWGSDAFLLRRLRALVAATRRLAAGDLRARSGPAQGSPELRELSRAFDDMATSLEARQVEAERSQRALHDSAVRFQRVVESNLIGILFWDGTGRITESNDVFLRMTGYTRADIQAGAISWKSITPEEYRRLDDQALGEIAQHGACAPYEKKCLCKDGSALPVLVGASLLEGQPDRGVGFMLDIAERKRAEERLNYLAHHDVLTGLPNRILFRERLQRAIVAADRYERLVGVLFLDLDGFKTINDTLGHEAGDQLIKAVAERLTGCVRAGDTVSRLSGDEFTIVLADMLHVDHAARVAGKILEIFNTPFYISDHELFITASIGITLYPIDDQNAEGLLQNADVAMYRAKETGRNSYQFYAAEMTTQARQRLTLENALRRALERDELLLYYQPIVNLAPGTLVGMEALLRWRHPELGLVSPTRFIALAEETGLIVPIGEWVLHQACTRNRAWQAEGLPPLRVSVNLSARQFHQKKLIGTLVRVLRETGLDPQWLGLELTESVLMHNDQDTTATLREVAGLGVHLAIDDFGTGYSALSYLRRFSIDSVKIDQSFIHDVPGNANAAAIVSAIIAMTRVLDIRVVAEGVETAEQTAFLLQAGCDTVQGYYFSEPLPEGEFVELLKSGRCLEPAHARRSANR